MQLRHVNRYRLLFFEMGYLFVCCFVFVIDKCLSVETVRIQKNVDHAFNSRRRRGVATVSRISVIPGFSSTAAADLHRWTRSSDQSFSLLLFCGFGHLLTHSKCRPAAAAVTYWTASWSLENIWTHDAWCHLMYERYEGHTSVQPPLLCCHVALISKLCKQYYRIAW